MTQLLDAFMTRDLDEWFVREILVHESALTRYLTKAWKSRAEVSDLRQETYARVYESAAKGIPHSPKSFLFTTARNLMTEKVCRARTVSVNGTQNLGLPDFSVDELTAGPHPTAQDELLQLARVFDSLSEPTRAVIWLLRIEGLSQREAA